MSKETLLFPGVTRNGLWVTIPAISAATFAAFLMVPWMPSMPAAGLDPSWAYAVNEAVAQNLVFGQNFVWTLGPFGSVYTHLYNPATDTIMLCGSVLSAAALCFGFVTLTWRRNALLVLLLIIVVTIVTPDTLLSALPALLLLVTFRLSLPSSDRLHLRSTPSTALCVSLLSCAVGILPLIKGTLLVLAPFALGLAVLTAVIGRQRTLALSIPSLAIISLCIAWVAAGQPLVALPRYFWSQGPIIAGYSEAMSLHGPFRQVIYWAVATAAAAAIVYVFVIRRRGVAGCVVALGLALYSFTTFKGGFVRQDGHVFTSAESLLLGGLILAALLDPLPAAAVAVIALLGWSNIVPSPGHVGTTVLAGLENRSREAANGLILRVNSPEALPAMFKQANGAIRREEPLPEVGGTADVYPVDLAPLFANGLEWAGRPIPQSYTAYTRALAEANAAHLAGSEAPTNVFFAVAPIDERLPALEDSLSWPLLLSRYSIAAFDSGYLRMVRKDGPMQASFEPHAVTLISSVNEWIEVPLRNGLVWTEIDMRPALLGRLVLTAYKLPRVWIELRLSNGRLVRHRYIPAMGLAGFLLSPYVGSTADFALMAADLDKGQEVRQIRIETPKVGLWSQRFTLSFKKLDIPAQPDLRRLVVVEPSSPPAFISASRGDPVGDCSLDFVDGHLFPSLKASITVNNDHVSVAGWTAPAARQGVGPDETWIALTGANGEHRFYRATATPRPDVLAFLKQPGLKTPGFLADLDLFGLSGTQKLTIYSAVGSQAFRCGQAAVLELAPDNPHSIGAAGK